MEVDVYHLNNLQCTLSSNFMNAIKILLSN